MQPVRTSLEDNRDHWEAQSISSYGYEFRRECFCPPEVVEPVVIRVIDGVVAEVELTENGEPVPQEEHDRYPTIDELFDEIEDAIEREAHEISVTYHPDLGYPTEAFIDFEEIMVDEERGFTASDLESLDAELLGRAAGRIRR